jgi:hypothetical protein
MSRIVLLVLMAQLQPVVVKNPAGTKSVTTSTSGAKELLDINCVSGCGGAGGAGGSSTQGPSTDGGIPWHVDVNQWGGAATSLGSKTSANSVPVVVASDQGAVPVSAASLPLPSNASTATNQTTLGSQTTKVNDGTNTMAVKAASTAAGASDPSAVVALSPNSALPAGSNVIGHVIADTGSTTTVTGTVAATVANLDVALSTRTKPSDQQHVIIDTVTPTVTVNGSGVTQPISAAALPLPTGAATDANLTTLLDGGVAALNAIAAELVNGQQTTKVSNLPPAPKRNLSGGAIVDGSGVVQPVSASTLPLPTGAAQESGGNLAGILARLAALTNGQMQTAVTLTQQPLNPFLQRCNQVRRTNCQP